MGSCSCANGLSSVDDCLQTVEAIVPKLKDELKEKERMYNASLATYDEDKVCERICTYYFILSVPECEETMLSPLSLSCSQLQLFLSKSKHSAQWARVGRVLRRPIPYPVFVHFYEEGTCVLMRSSSMIPL